MKKLVVSVLALLSMASFAMGIGFSLPGVTETTAGSEVVIPVNAVGQGAIQGVNLNMEVDAALVFLDASFDAGTIFDTKHTAPNIMAAGQYLIAGTTTTSGTVATPGVVALVKVSIPAGTALGDYFIRTEVPDFGAVSNFTVIDADAQGSGLIRVVPEPATALLLIGALPLIRRRKA